MASYQIKDREPLLDATMQEAIERRGKELLGFTLLGIALVLAMILGSYVPDDPSWLSATDAPAQNLLGHFGASLAAPLFIVVGWGAWGLVLVPAAWGVRLVGHWGEERLFSRMIFAPIAVALAAVYASTHVPPASWTHSFGMGGLFGDTVLGALLNLAPVDTVLGLRLLAGLVWLATLAMMLFVLGLDRAELRRFTRLIVIGVILTYEGLRRLAGKSARGAMDGALRGAEAFQTRLQERRARAADVAGPAPAAVGAATSRVTRAEPPVHADDVAPADPAPRPRAGLFARMPALMRRVPDEVPEPELVEPELPALDGDLDPLSEDRIKARIADVIKSRARQSRVAPAARAEPPLRRRGPQPLILNDRLVAEPPLTAAAPVPEIEPEAEAPLSDAVIEPFAQPAMPRPAIPLAEPRKVVQHPPRKTVQPSRRAIEEAQPALKFDEGAELAELYETPPLSLLSSPSTVERLHLSDEALEENARMLENVLDDYGVKGEIVSVRPGPVVTMYELEPAPGLKASRVIGLADDIARSMSALSARVSTVPGRSVIGIELPNSNREKVMLREILSARQFGDTSMRLPLALGKDIGGEPVVANLAKMPHLLIAGTTGSGKSVAINTMILSLLYKLSPDECRLIMIDPKMLELSVYDGIPHLLSPVVTDPKKAVVALKWVVAEMEERYRKMSKMGVRNIEGYNGRVLDAQAKGEMFKRTVQTGFDDETGEPVFETEEFLPETLPYIVVIVDEMADLMMVAGKEIEACIQRLAQMARASGIHLIMATQRPSVDVITGTIKANFPTRISFQVTGKIDSRTILGEQGAEQLLGMGDMLYMAGGGRISRVHGPFVSDEEVEEIVTFLKAFGPPDYVGSVLDGPDEDKESDIDAVLGLGGNTSSDDALYDQAVAIVLKDRKCSTSYIQRKLAIGYNKAARLVEQMEEEGVVSPANHVGKREILVPEQG
ncbi:S-DNA-T family DNA segregation ATPase FtsK/SpoIIIE [Rhodovulum bhavnagarense]|uniref:DNA translocase FtsK n=1 Tax=Rhodovulum bhavnagarense TaxID=992286 RepID=A0A4R2RGA9_9RHOB|nr:DNA translocase FtsK [Rhodovulum bhavnagarense]TCP61598.1 S-DNA-T family DNA segregation ATPase FtsK/SpoIIIE [Rhodovulum bhavnagarense]